MFFVTWFFIYVFGSYKAYGSLQGHSDQFLTLASALAQVINALTRLATGSLVDKISFKSTYSFFLVMSFGLGVTFHAVAHCEKSFIIYLCLTNCVQGSTFVVFPTLFANIYGPEIG